MGVRCALRQHAAEYLAENCGVISAVGRNPGIPDPCRGHPVLSQSLEVLGSDFPVLPPPPPPRAGPPPVWIRPQSLPHSDAGCWPPASGLLGVDSDFKGGALPHFSAFWSGSFAPL